MKSPSLLFMEAFSSHTSGCVRTCVCGRTHFDVCESNGWTWDEGELEQLRAKAETDPSHYVPSDGAVGSYEVGGDEIVWGCPCDTGAKYERFIIHHAEQIAVYLNARAAQLRKEAESTMVGLIEKETP